ncbi:glycogen-binding subunit 76A-like [Saccostrea cucullata]|uniref:glycogen-binding subunit 76A-like n=1 Tax=Saccostrea cuccullata TaxID=36930 RepID=UPI002ED2F5E6
MYNNLTDPEASIGAFFLPRNLSYTESSYLDCYSVSSNFVYNPRVDRELYFNAEVEAAKHVLERCSKLLRLSVSMNAEEDIDFVPNGSDNVNELIVNQKSDLDDDALLFAKDMDDLNSVGSSTGKSSVSDDANDDAYSPESNDLAGTSQGCGGSLEDAVAEAMQVKMHSDRLKKCSPPPFVFTDMSFTPSSDDDDAEADVAENKTESSLKKDKSFGSQKSLYEENEFNIDKAELRKSSSLKAKKTPPGTPSRKKMVRFADALGLDLEDVRHVLNAENPPKIPASAMADLKVGVETERKDFGKRFLHACFQQPGASENFLQKVLAQKVCLENAIVTDLTITGVVRVANIGFHKVVRVRYTYNAWVSYHDIMASYVQNSCDGPTDRFSFSICAPADLGVSSKLEFALSYTVGDIVYWDNNEGNNYVFECFAKTTPTESRDSWLHFL